MRIRSNHAILMFLLMLVLASISCNHTKESTSIKNNTQTGTIDKVDIQTVSSSLKKELGEDWKLDVRNGLQYGNLKEGIEVFGTNEALEFSPPGLKGEKYAVLHLYMHPLSIGDVPPVRPAIQSVFSSVVGETDSHRVYGGVIAPHSHNLIMAAVRTALNIQWGQAINGLRCRLEKPEGTFVTGRPAIVTILLQNVGSEPKSILDIVASPDGTGFCLCSFDDGFGVHPPEVTSDRVESGETVILKPKQILRRNLNLSDWTVRENNDSITDLTGKHTIVGFYCPAKPDKDSFHPDKVYSTPMIFYVESKE